MYYVLMLGDFLYAYIYTIAPYAPLLIIVASALDIFFITGFLLYGVAMMGTVLMLHVNDMISVQSLIITAIVGTLLGNVANYWVGYWFGEAAFIQKKLSHPRIQKLRNKMLKRGLWLFIIVTRFITFTRPFYALLLGSLKIPFAKFIVREIVIASVWVIFWLIIILQSETLYFKIFG